jgi:hypothetical protein
MQVSRLIICSTLAASALLALWVTRKRRKMTKEGGAGKRTPRTPMLIGEFGAELRRILGSTIRDMVMLQMIPNASEEQKLGNRNVLLVTFLFSACGLFRWEAVYDFVTSVPFIRVPLGLLGLGPDPLSSESDKFPARLTVTDSHLYGDRLAPLHALVRFIQDPSIIEQEGMRPILNSAAITYLYDYTRSTHRIIDGERVDYETTTHGLLYGELNSATASVGTFKYEGDEFEVFLRIRRQQNSRFFESEVVLGGLTMAKNLAVIEAGKVMLLRALKDEIKKADPRDRWTWSGAAWIRKSDTPAPLRTRENVYYTQAVLKEILAVCHPAPDRASLLATLGQSDRRSLLLIGPPRCGKSTVASFVSSETGWPVYEPDLSVWSGAALTRQLASIKPGSIVLFDDAMFYLSSYNDKNDPRSRIQRAHLKKARDLRGHNSDPPEATQSRPGGMTTSNGSIATSEQDAAAKSRDATLNAGLARENSPPGHADEGRSDEDDDLVADFDTPDDIALLMRRHRGGSTVSGDVLHSLQHAMDNHMNGCIVIASTNDIEGWPPSLFERFDLQLRIDTLCDEQLRALLSRVGVTYDRWENEEEHSKLERATVSSVLRRIERVWGTLEFDACKNDRPAKLAALLGELGVQLSGVRSVC